MLVQTVQKSVEILPVLDKAVGMPLVCINCGVSAVTVHRQFGSRGCRYATTGADGPDSAAWS